MTQDEIIDMARQAGCFEKHQVFYFTQQDLEAFAKLVAELIVRECIDIADETALGDTTYGWMVANRIKEHFGVEE